jgi:hypothetical protein
MITQPVKTLECLPQYSTNQLFGHHSHLFNNSTSVVYVDTQNPDSSLYRKAFKRNISETDQDVFRDELGILCQKAHDPTQFLDINNNQNVGFGPSLEEFRIRDLTSQELGAAEAVEDTNQGFKTVIMYNDINLLDIDKDKSTENLTLATFALNVIRKVFNKSELTTGIIGDEDGKTRSKIKTPLDYDRIEIVKG